MWAFHQDVDDQTRQNADQPIDMDRDATLYTTRNLLLRREIQFLSHYMKASTWNTGGGGDFTPTTKWGAAGSDPMRDVYSQQTIVKGQTGFTPKTLIVSYDVDQALRNNAAVLDRIKYTQKGVVTADLLAALFDVDNYLVAGAVVNTAAEGATFAGQFLMANSALLVYSNKAPSILQPSGGYIFSWQGLFGAGAQGNRVMTFRMEHLKSDRIEAEMAFDMKLVGADLGVYFTAVLS